MAAAVLWRLDYHNRQSLTELCIGPVPPRSPDAKSSANPALADVAGSLLVQDTENFMRQIMYTLSLVGSLLAVAPAIGDRADAQTAFSVSAHIGDFHVAVANYYRVPEREVIVIRERRIPDDEIPVALFIADRAGVPWARVVDMRLRGDSWWDISVRFGLGPEVYYVPVAVTPGPPYGRALGHYKKKKRTEWRTIVLSDADVVNLVELRFLTEHYHVAPERVIALRGDDRDFVAIHADVRGNNSRHGDDDDQGKQGGRGHGKGRHKD